MPINSRWLKYARYREDGKWNLICFPHAGGSAIFFKGFEHYFAEHVNMLPVQLPMRENRVRESMPATIQELARLFVQENQRLFQKPYAIFGHSLGAIISLEVAYTAIHCVGRKPSALFVSGTKAPIGRRKTDVVLSDEDIYQKLFYLDGMHHKLLNNTIFMDYFLPVIRTDLQLYQRYEWSHTELLDCAVYAFGGDKDQHTSEVDLQSWRRSSTRYIGEALFEGGHFYLAHHKKQMAAMMERIVREEMKG